MKFLFKCKPATVAILLLASAFLFNSCSIRHQVQVPEPIVSTQASFDGNIANSGLIGPTGRGGFYVTKGFIIRYDGLLSKYGDRFVPPVKFGDRTGITAHGQDFEVTAEMLARFRLMNSWRRAEAGP